MGKWLATTWEGTVVKSLTGALLGAFLSWITTSEIHPLLIALSCAAVPTIINAINKLDNRYGVKAETSSDAIASPVPDKDAA